MYACLKCGYVHKGNKVVREREDYEQSTRFCNSIFHGFVTYIICPKCKYKQQIKVEEDKK